MRSEHAEGPVYDPLTDELLWVDIPAGLVNVARLGPGFERGAQLRDGRRRRARSSRAAIRPTAGWSRAGTGSPPSTGPAWSPPIAEPERGPPTRMNDGKCDPFGGFWAGSMASTTPRAPPACTASPRTARAAPRSPGVTTSNGLAWRDPEHMYYVDTPTRRVDLLTVTPDGAVTDRRPAFAVPAELGLPRRPHDRRRRSAVGRAVGRRGRGVLRPGRQVLATVEVDAAQVSCCTFAGPDLATLVITTSQESYTPGRSAAEPWSGHLFVADVGARGLPPYRFG